MSLLRLLPALILAIATTARADGPAAPLKSGIDLTSMDRSVRPQDDLFRHANGTWLATAPFPPEYPRAGIIIWLFEKAEGDVHRILLEAAAAGEAATPAQQRLGDLYASFMDEARVEARGIAPLAPLFAEIAAIDGPAALAAFFGRAQGLGISVPMGVFVSPDDRNATHNIAFLTQSGLGLPNRDYYLRDDETHAGIRAKYVDYLAKLFTLAGETDGAARAGRILALETKIATDQWTPVQDRDPVATYNRHGIDSAT
ncbi:MAG TPA: M13 family metallopeptidase N-terminal domain-containing protein, partial [Steroidobacteraceae bacterium]